MSKWTEEFNNISTNDTSTGIFTYTDDLNRWMINLAYARSGWPVLTLTPALANDLARLKTTFHPQDYTYVEDETYPEARFLKLEIKSSEGMYSKQFIFSRLQFIIPEFNELKSMLNQTGLLNYSANNDDDRTYRSDFST